MEPTTLRLPAALADSLTEEAQENGFSSRSEYIRHILRNRTEYVSNTDPAPDRIRTEYEPGGVEELRDRVDDLEARVADLETTESILSPPARSESDSGTETVDTPRGTAETPGSHTPDDSGDSSIEDVIAECRRDWARQNTDEKVAEMAAAARAALELLQDGAELRGSDLQDRLQPEHPVRDQDPDTDTYWRKTLRPALQEAADHDLVRQQQGSWLWRWIAE